LGLWAKLLPIVKPEGVTKIGLRYINRIAKDERHPHIGDWLRASDYLPAVLLASRRHLFARIEASPGEDDLLLMTVADQADVPPHGAVILDIDHIRAKAVAVDADEIGRVLEDLHEEIWSVFWTSRTEDKLNAKAG
jgi:uncharacterized protein (TIGR04255 family)